MKWTRQRWCATPWNAAAQRGDQPGVLVGDDQPDPGQAALLQPGQERPPEHLVLAVADVQAEDLAAPVGGDAGGDHDGLGGDLPSGGARCARAGRSRPGTRTGTRCGPAAGSGTRRRPRPGRHRSGRPRSWRSRSRPSRPPGRRPPGWTPRARTPPSPPRTGPGRSAVAAAAPTGRTTRPAASGSHSATSPALVVNSRGRDPLRSVTRVVGALIPAGADHLGRLGLDQLLQHDAHRLADQIDAVTGTERVQQLGQGRLGQGPSVRSPSMSTWRYTPRITPMAPSTSEPLRYPKPHHSRGLSPEADSSPHDSSIARSP